MPHIYRIVIALIFIALPASAQDELVGDRPDLTESALTVGHLRVQLETGFAWERFKQAGIEENNFFNPTLLRFGFGRDFELRLETASFSYTDSETGLGEFSHSGFSPVSIGMKYTFANGAAEGLPTMGILLMTELPSGTDVFQTEDLATALKLIAEFDLTPSMGFATNVGFENSYDDLGENYYNLLITGSLGIDLSDRTGAFFELAANSKEWSGGEESLVFDAGVTYLVTDGFQVDMALGTGLKGDFVPDFFMTAGLIYKP
jgi:hypothetical protein